MTYPTSSRRNKRTRPQAEPIAVMCGVCQPAEPDGAYYSHRQQHQQQQQQQTSSYSPAKPMHHDGYLPKTVSACTTATASSSRSAHSAASCMVDSLCPVTGVYANIADDYHVRPEVIGRGHYGVVRECTHRATRRNLAVKTIQKSKIGRLDHLQREIYLLANVNHEGIMNMVDCYEDADCVHIITEKYTGGELFDRIVESTSPRGCMSEREAASVMKSLLEAIAYLHDNGVVHRDVKPENVLFESRREDAAVRLIDFGLARRHDRNDGPMSNPVGTAYYMAPELLKGRYDSACDVWSAGVVAYIMLCGYPPFNGSTDSEIQDATRRGRLHFAGGAWLTKSDDCVDFVRCLLRRDPRKRFTAREALMHPWIRNMMAF